MNTLVNSQSNKDRLMQEISAVAAETEKLIHHAGQVAGSQSDAVRASLEDSFHQLQQRFNVVRESVAKQTREAARATDTYVHDKPWQAVGIAAGVGLLVGILASSRAHRS